MESVAAINTAILLGAILVTAGILSSLVASRFGAPLLLVFLAIGMLAGEDGLGGISFENVEATYLIGSIALAVILFDGGMRTKVASFRVALRPAIVLATLGVILTAAITAAFAVAIFRLGTIEALLMGAIVASTDAAAVFFLIHGGGLRLSERVGMTLEIESGTNDPFAVFLALVLVELAAGMVEPGVVVLTLLLRQALVGAVLGVLGGLGLSFLLNRLKLPSGLQPLFVTTGAVLIFGVAGWLDGSGFLAVYLAGLVVGNRPMRGFSAVVAFQDAATWFCQIVMFLILGLLVTPSRMLPVLLPALGLALALMLVARPLAVWLCLLPFRFSWRETAFVAWVGLRGAVGIFLAALPMLAGLPGAELYFNIAFVVVLASLLVQGWTLTPVARALGVALQRIRHPVSRVELALPGQLEAQIVGYPVPDDSHVLRGAEVPGWARPVLVVRGEQTLAPDAAGELRAGDHVYLLAPPWRVHLLDRLFAPPDEVAEEDRDFFGEFAFNGDATLGDLAALYGLPVPPERRPVTLSRHFADTISAHPVIGDRIAIGGSALIVREVDGDRVTQVGLQLEPPARPSVLRRIRGALARIRRRPP